MRSVADGERSMRLVQLEAQIDGNKRRFIAVDVITSYSIHYTKLYEPPATIEWE